MKTNKKITEYNEITNFLNKYRIIEHNEGTTIIESQENIYMIRNIQINESMYQEKNQQLNQIIATLSQHQTFKSKNILSLLDFQIVYSKDKSQSQIRAVYQYGRKSLFQEIQSRKQSNENFQEDALWGLLYSITTPLVYLQQQNVIYGVIDSSRVFIDNNISILDPSSTGIDPYQLMENRLYSPQLRRQDRLQDEIDMFKSDVYALGLLMLQAALLKFDIYDYDQDIITMCLNSIQQIYSENFFQLMKSMLETQPSERPSFQEVLNHITQIFEISTTQIDILQPLSPDKQDQGNQICHYDNTQRQNIDILQTQYIRYEQSYHEELSTNQTQRLKFYKSQNNSQNQSYIEQFVEQSHTSSFYIQDSRVRSLQKSKRVYKAKQIKDKLVRHQQTYEDDLKQFVTFQQHKRHQRSKSNWQQEKNKNIGNQNLNFTQFYRHSKQNLKGDHSSRTRDGLQIYDNSLNKQDLFTQPYILNMIKNDLQRIGQRKKNSVKVSFNYPQQQKELMYKVQKQAFNKKKHIINQNAHFRLNQQNRSINISNDLNRELINRNKTKAHQFQNFQPSVGTLKKIQK